MDVLYHEVERAQLPIRNTTAVDYDSKKTSYLYSIASPVSARECDVDAMVAQNSGRW